MGATDFVYNAEHRVVICRKCGTCLAPGGPKAWKDHLGRKPHWMKGDELRTTVELLSTYDLRGKEELRKWRPGRRTPCEPIEALAEHPGYICLCETETCDFVTTRLEAMHGHMPRHGVKASQHSQDRPLWEVCVLQTYFTAKGRIDYFTVRRVSSRQEEVTSPSKRQRGGKARGTEQPLQYIGLPPSQAEEALFDGLRSDLHLAGRDLAEKASIVDDAAHHRADRERWLIHTGFATHLCGLKDAEIWSSFKLPKRETSLSSGQPNKVKQEDGKQRGPGQGNDGGRNGAGEHQGGGQDEEDDLQRILAAAEALFISAYALVSDRSPTRKMTQQRAQILSDFAWGAGKKGKDTAFRCFKNPSSLADYFRTTKQLLVYYYRVVYREDGHFTRPWEEGDREEGQTDGKVPRDTIEPTDEQQRAMREMFRALREEDSATAFSRPRGADKVSESGSRKTGHCDSRLACAIRRFYIGLICHEVGGVPLRSPVISFCAMLSRKKPRNGSGHDRKRKKSSNLKGGHAGADGEPVADDGAPRRPEHRLGAWVKPGNYTSRLSMLVWMAQLMIFETACFYKKDEDEDQVPAALEKVCRKFMHQRGETAFGHILQWRLYLGTVGDGAISNNQARWSLDGQQMDLQGKQFRMDHVPQLVTSEYRRARAILYDKLLFGAKDMASIETWMLHDDLDAEEYGGSWLTDERNAEYLRGTHDALLRQIEQRADLRRAFIRDEDGQDGARGKRLCRQAMAVYECEAQEFLKSMVPLLHVPPAPPLRAPELLSVTIANSGGRRRSMFVWEKMLMIYVRYHKSLEQTGDETDNIRFVPSHIADLLFTYLAIVQPLRQVFLRQVRPGALLSPYLWSSLDGDVWRDGRVSKHLSQACERAQVPEFKVAWWRQAAASITKQKFTPKERANFNMDTIMAPEVIDEEEPLVDLATSSNHGFKTFNQLYAGSTTLVMSTPLHRAYRASQSWRALFRIDEHLSREEAAGDGGKRLRSVAESEEQGMAQMCKRAKMRTRPTGKASELEAVARALYNEPTLRFRRPGQHDALLATMGRRAEEQVVVVLGTGSGKTLIAMVGAALDGAGTTIMVLPAVALREDMLDRLDRIGLRTIVWEPGQSKSAPLVIVSAEAACTITFLEYVQRLQSRQRLDRIIVDECHLTITATYRKCMKKLGSYVRQVPTQTVWMTATLPPDFERLFIRQNRLVQPRIVRESTNRTNIRYSVQRFRGLDGLCERAAMLVRSLLARIADSEGDNAGGHNGEVTAGTNSRIIVYCQTVDLVKELARELDCPMYTGDDETMTDEQKDLALKQWKGPSGPKVIVATAALGIGVDYAEVRWVVHAGAPRSMFEFAQESGRAGRDGKPAESITLLSEAWQPRAVNNLDGEMMQLYLTQQYCSRAVMSQFLDKRADWKWCMEGEDELCAACPKPHTKPRPADLELHLPNPSLQEADMTEERDDDVGSGDDEKGLVDVQDMAYTGPDEVLRQAMVHSETRARFEADLEVMRTCCLLCRVEGGRPFDHSATTCGRRWPWINAKKKVFQACTKEGKPWMEDYTACFRCYLPQTICSRADTEKEAEDGGMESSLECRFRDSVLPLCYGAFFRAGPRALIKKHFPRTFANIDDYMRWLGTSATLGDMPCVQAVCVAAILLAELR